MVTAIGMPDPQIIFTKAWLIQHKQFVLTKNVGQYLGIILLSTKVLGIGIQKGLLQMTNEM